MSQNNNSSVPPARRRRIFYVDRIFQKRLLALFLGLNAALVIANIVYYFTHLEGVVEENMYRSHISISNISELLAGDILFFNVLLAGASLLLVLAFYSMVRLNMNSFFTRVQAALDVRQRPEPAGPSALEIPESFHKIDRVMGEFFLHVDNGFQKDRERLQELKKLLAEHEIDK